MALSREEIDQIAETTAEKVVAKSKGNPVREPMYSECRCGGAATNMISAFYHTQEDFRQFRKLTDLHHTTLEMSFRALESSCPADMAKVDEVIKRVKKAGAISKRDMDESLNAIFQGFQGCMAEAVKVK